MTQAEHPQTPRSRFMRWLRKYRGPHTCLSCGEPLTFGANDAGRYAVLCGRMWLSLGDGYLRHNHPGHTVRVTVSRPDFDCDHDHEERSLWRGYPV